MFCLASFKCIVVCVVHASSVGASASSCWPHLRHSGHLTNTPATTNDTTLKSNWELRQCCVAFSGESEWLSSFHTGHTRRRRQQSSSSSVLDAEQSRQLHQQILRDSMRKYYTAWFVNCAPDWQDPTSSFTAKLADGSMLPELDSGKQPGGG